MALGGVASHEHSQVSRQVNCYPTRSWRESHGIKRCNRLEGRGSREGKRVGESGIRNTGHYPGVKGGAEEELVRKVGSRSNPG